MEWLTKQLLTYKNSTRTEDRIIFLKAVKYLRKILKETEPWQQEQIREQIEEVVNTFDGIIETYNLYPLIKK